MPGRYKQSQNKNKSRFYILLSVIFIIVMIKWGVPLFMNLVAGTGSYRVATGKDITNSANITVEGFTESGARVELLINDVVDSVSIADEAGSFLFDSRLILGQNRVQLRAKDEAGNESMSEVALIYFDNKPIDLVVSSPKDGSEYFGKINQVIDVKGSVDKPNSQVLVNNSFVQVDRNGSFVFRFMLSGGENTIKVVASDSAGNFAEKTLKLIYTP
jgi:ABC-type Na+ efflux pump permease subunit